MKGKYTLLFEVPGLLPLTKFSLKNILNDLNHDLVHFNSNIISGNSAVSFPSPGWGLDIDGHSFQYPENVTVSSPYPEGELTLSTPRGHSVEEHYIAGASGKENASDQNIKSEHNNKQNIHSENSDYMDPTSNTDSWTQSDSNGFESFEYWVLREALASDPDLFARSLSLFQAEWERKNIPRSPGVVSQATTGDSTSENGGTSTAMNATSQKESERHFGKHNLPTRDPDEGDETDGERRPKRQKQTRDSNKPYDGPRFACPFYRKDPSKYCPSTIVGGTYAGDKYANCHKYGSIELHRLVR